MDYNLSARRTKTNTTSQQCLKKSILSPFSPISTGVGLRRTRDGRCWNDFKRSSIWHQNCPTILMEFQSYLPLAHGSFLGATKGEWMIFRVYGRWQKQPCPAHLTSWTRNCLCAA